MNVRECIACGWEGYVINTRSINYKKNEVIYRRRECPNCKNRWSTLEVPAKLALKQTDHRGGNYCLEIIESLEDDI